MTVWQPSPIAQISPARRRRGGMTLSELLVAVLISVIFIAGVVGAFARMYLISEEAKRKMDAINNARAALEIISLDLAGARLDPAAMALSFLGENRDFGDGDRIDNDDDGQIDEELPNGADDDGDYNSATDDRHTSLGLAIYERALLRNLPDIGDAHVDEDVTFQDDRLDFVKESTFVPGQLDRISYAIGSHDGLDNVLLRNIDYNIRTQDAADVTTDPLAFDIVSINFLYWDANRLDPRNPRQPGPLWPPYWVEEWDSNLPLRVPGIPLPVAVRIEITVYAGSTPLDQLQPGEPMETVSLSTTVNVEQALNDPRYELVRQHLSTQGQSPGPAPAGVDDNKNLPW